MLQPETYLKGVCPGVWPDGQHIGRKALSLEMPPPSKQRICYTNRLPCCGALMSKGHGGENCERIKHGVKSHAVTMASADVQGECGGARPGLRTITGRNLNCSDRGCTLLRMFATDVSGIGVTIKMLKNWLMRWYHACRLRKRNPSR